MKKSRIFIILGVIVLVISSLLVTYNILLGRVSNNNEIVYFTIEKGSSVKNIVSELKKADIIKSNLATLIYLKFHKMNLQAGTYELNRSMNTKDILEKISLGQVKNNTKTLTFIEGKRLLDYVNLIASNFSYTEEEIINTLNDKNYLKELIDKYWFLNEDILKEGIYYPLEGYLYPDTYIFYDNASIKEIIGKMLDNTDIKLKGIKEEVENSGYSVHELLTLASIIELEGASSEDRKGVSSVFYNRLKAGWNLGSDVTTYYAEQKAFSVPLTVAEYNECNDYNTRSNCLEGLPIGPICNMGMTSLDAALNPSNTDYYYFVASKDNKTYFSKTDSEQQEVIKKLQEQGLW